MQWKNYFTDGLVQIALVLSLYRTNLDNFGTSPYEIYPDIQEVIMGPLSGYTRSYAHVPEWHTGPMSVSHPKALSLDYHSSVFRELHSLGQYQRFQRVDTDINAYLVSDQLNAQLSSESAQTSQEQTTTPQPVATNNELSNQQHNSTDTVDLPSPQVEGAVGIDQSSSNAAFNFEFAESELSKEDMDLIEILWRQDIDLGVSREAFDAVHQRELEKERELELHKQREKEQEYEKQKTEEKNYENNNENVTYTIDRETGELIPVASSNVTDITNDHVPFTHTPPQQQQSQDIGNNEFSIEEAMRILEEGVENFNLPTQEPEDRVIGQQLQELEAMITSVGAHYNDSVNTQPQLQHQNSVEQRWQDIDQLIPLDGSTNSSGALDLAALFCNTTNSTLSNLTQQQSLLHDAQLAPQTAATFAEGFSPVVSYPTNLTGQNLISDVNNSSRLMSTAALGLPNATLGQHQRTGSFINSSETLLQQLLNDEIEMNFDHINTTGSGPQHMEINDTSSDSAISSGEGSSNTSNDITNFSEDHSDFHSNISSPCDALEGATGGHSDSESSTSYQPMETKYKYEQDYTYEEYSDSNGQLYLNHSDGSNETQNRPSSRQVNHNHTYPLQPGQQPKERKMRKSIKDEIDFSESAQYSRDQKRAKSLNVPFTMEEMINSPVEEFNEMMQAHRLNETQLQLIRDIRRRGKNKVAAQNCRKRKLEVIQTLEEEVEQMRADRNRLRDERRNLDKESEQMRQKFSHLYKEVFQSLRDEQGQPYDPNEFSLQQTDDGDVFLVPENGTTRVKDEPKTKGSRKRKGERKGQ